MHNEKGFTLVELAIVLVIVGTMMGGAMSMMKPYVESAQLNATKEKLNKISDSLAMYVQNYGRLPCPADANPGGTEPFGSPMGSTVDGDELDNACGTPVDDYIGIVPFRALGLNEENVRDGYGNLITYAVSEVLATPVIGAATNVHSLCRTQSWVDAIALDANKARKSRFCCPRFLAGADLIVNDQRVGGVSSFGGFHESVTGGGNYGTVNSVQSPATNNFGNRLIGFVLLSHGKNGDRAYIANRAARNPVTVNAGAEESENYDLDLTFVDRAISKSNDTNYFDDVILWRTNDQIISAFGNDSCGKP